MNHNNLYLFLLLSTLGSCIYKPVPPLNEDSKPTKKTVYTNATDASVCDAAYGDPIFPERNFGSSEDLRNVAWTASRHNVSKFVWRTYLDFKELKTFNRRVRIDSAFLTLHAVSNHKYYAGGQHGDNTISIFPVVNNWEENEITWLNKPDFVTAVSVVGPVSQNESIRINITEIIRHNIENDGHGLMIKLSEEEVIKSRVFFSSDSEDSLKRPKLEIYHN